MLTYLIPKNFQPSIFYMSQENHVSPFPSQRDRWMDGWTDGQTDISNYRVA